MTAKADETRRRILSVALTRFREDGYHKTTMRGIARASGLSLGAAYHHFEGKQDIVRAYYGQQMDAHEAATREAWREGAAWQERVSLVLHTSLDVRATDRALMRELAPLVVGTDEAASAFSGKSADLRGRSIALFHEAIDDPAVPEDLRDVLATALWALSMGTLLYFAHDESPRQRKSRALVDGSVELLGGVVSALALPPLAPLRGRLREVLEDASLIF
ncbi:MAG: TetR/AcrR family transcriptional regulator [Sandaracinaceae bacterium]|nr:TetR/AcrR family transcriptional regulator [Sandaracinaceae bacterium]